MEEQVVLVDANDHAIGLMPKQECHIKGALHRAFSVFIFNSKGELLLQQRALSKYHTPGLWTNTCCSHPRDGETISQAAGRRLHEEMGMTCDLTEMFKFTYCAPVGQNLIEHEIDHVLFGNTDNQPQINTDEVASWKYASMDFLKTDIKQNPDNYTAWFKIVFHQVEEQIK